jgi:5-oxopent-3-ene-1,2,5-tricarboxylate decarboxylase/2-hydroxyhepta-2,4-diene-1,7-dioate isomerase
MGFSKGIPMKLFSFQLQNGEFGIGIEIPEGTFNLTRAFEIYQDAKRVHDPVSFAFIQVMVELGYFNSQALTKIMEDPWVRSKSEDLRLSAEFRFGVPIQRPSKIIAIGRNYLAHVKELKHEVPSEPIFFSKAPSSLIPHETDIVIPAWLDGRVDHEAELALIIGKTCRNAAEDAAMEYIAGYSIVNDVTARTMQKEDIEHGNPWFRSKSIDTFCPMGPYIVPADDLASPEKLEIQLTINGETKQKARVSSMIFPLPKLVSAVSRYMTLEPGDIIATGTPEGVSPINGGDVIEITVTGLGTLRNKVVKEIQIS